MNDKSPQISHVSAGSWNVVARRLQPAVFQQRNKAAKWLVLAAGAVLALGGWAGAAAAEPDAPPKFKLNVNGNQLEYQIHLSDPDGGVAKVTATFSGVADGDKPAQPRVVPADVHSFADAGNWAAILFMIDISSPSAKGAPSRAKSVEASKRFVTSFCEMRRSHQRMAVYTYTSQLQQLPSAYFGVTPSELTGALKGVKPEKGDADTYGSLHDAILVLQKYGEAQRKAIVILTSGTNRENNYREDQELVEAKKAGIVIFAVGFPDQQQDYPYLSALERMARETQGKYDVADLTTKNLPDKFDAKIGECVDAGGVATVDTTDAKPNEVVEFEIQTKAGEIFKDTYTFPKDYVPSVSPVPVPPTPTPGPNIQKNPWEWLKDTPVAMGAAIGIVVLLIVLILWLCLRKREPYPPYGFGPGSPTVDPNSFPGSIEHVDDVNGGGEPTVRLESNGKDNEEGPTRMLKGGAGGGRSFARLKIIEGDSVPDFLMRRSTINIGRDGNQDMVLTNDSVHRAHAVISRKPDGSFLLTNLRAKNGVYVNGDEVETDCLIKHGDTIELGEVHLKFQVV